MLCAFEVVSLIVAEKLQIYGINGILLILGTASDATVTDMNGIVKVGLVLEIVSCHWSLVLVDC